MLTEEKLTLFSQKFRISDGFPSSFVTNFPHLTYRPKAQNHKRKTQASVTHYTHTTASAADFNTRVQCKASNMRINSKEVYINNVVFTSYNVRHEEKKSDTRHGRQEVAMS
jgi:hypothetical protein